MSFREFPLIWCRCIHLFEPVLGNASLQLARKREFDTHEVLAAAGTKWNFLPFKPGLVGGHCIGVDPYYLAHKAQEYGYHPEIILAGHRLNDNMGNYIASEVVKLMISRDHKIKGANVLILGITAASCHLYGIGDNYLPQNSHVIPALILPLHQAKINGASVVSLWGTCAPRREFHSVDDMAVAGV